MDSQWIKIDDKRCMLNLNIKGQMESFPLFLEETIENLTTMITNTLESYNWYLLFNEERDYSCYTSIKEVYGKKVSIVFSEVKGSNNWKDLDDEDYSFSIYVLDKEYKFRMEYYMSIGKALIEIIREERKYYLIFYLDDDPIVDLDISISQVYNRSITCKVIRLYDYED